MLYFSGVEKENFFSRVSWSHVQQGIFDGLNVQKTTPVFAEEKKEAIQEPTSVREDAVADTKKVMEKK